MSKPGQAELERVKSGEVTGAAAVQLLEATGEFVYHGSTVVNLTELEPRQGHQTHPVTHMKTPDGPPAVSASPFGDVAIFNALMNRAALRQSGILTPIIQFGILNGSPFLGADRETVNFMRQPSNSGTVYVFRRSDFQEFDNRAYELRSFKPVSPECGIRVTGRDLPDEIAPFRPKLIN